MQSKKWILAVVILATAIVCALSKEVSIKYVLAEILYGSQNNESPIVFSKESGFYDEEFVLKIYAPTEEIYYTLDGSEPDCNSIRYTGEIVIADATQNPNNFSMRTDVSARFLTDIVEENCGDITADPVYIPPEFNIDKCNVIKAVCYDENGSCSKAEERVYFVGYDDKEGYQDVNIISITTDPINLFDKDNGIYVLGDTFEDFYYTGKLEGFWAQKNWNHWPGNYNQRGYDWEKEATINVFDAQKNKVVSQNVGFRIQGGGSRGFLPKSLNLYARDEYGTDRIYYDFFDIGYYPKRITLSSGGDDYYSKIKDRLVSELSQETAIAVMNYEPYVLFLNGEYWGFYYLTEKYDEQYIEHHYGVTDIVMIKNGLIEISQNEDQELLYNEMVEFISNNDMSKDENYQKACELIDMDSFIDYFAVQSYIARCGDWPKSNFALWRSSNVSEKAYEDGKWRWMLFDVNSGSMMGDWPEYDYIEENRKDSRLFDSLCENEEFKYKFSSKMIELSNTIFEKEKVNRKINEYIQLMDEPMEKHFQRFFGTSNELFRSEVENIRQFFYKRELYVKEIIKNHFGEKYIGD